MEIRKHLLTASAASIMIFSFNAAYAKTTVEPFIDDATGSFIVSGSFDNTVKDWITLTVYRGKLTQKEAKVLALHSVQLLKSISSTTALKLQLLQQTTTEFPLARAI